MQNHHQYQRGIPNPNAATLSGILGISSSQPQNQQSQQGQIPVQLLPNQNNRSQMVSNSNAHSLLAHLNHSSQLNSHDAALASINMRQTLATAAHPHHMQNLQSSHQLHTFNNGNNIPSLSGTVHIQGPNHQKQLDLLILSRQMSAPHLRARLATHPQTTRNAFIQQQLQSSSASENYGFYTANPDLSLSPPQHANATGTGAGNNVIVNGRADRSNSNSANGSNNSNNNNNNNNNNNSNNNSNNNTINNNGNNKDSRNSSTLMNSNIFGSQMNNGNPGLFNDGQMIDQQSSTDSLVNEGINSNMYMSNNQVRSSDTGSDWTIVDLGGMQLRNISKNLYNYDFLTALYLNHNNITQISSSICKLNNLVHLDLSGNKLTTIPAELGLVYTLKELLLFDNELNYLPFELGRLFQLEFLGIEGNPLHSMYTNLIQKDGTSSLIQYLRENLPIGPPPAEREWITLTDDDTDQLETDISFTLMCYNILGEKYATQQSYGYIPSWALDWSWRRDVLLQDILNYSADVVCLQEVDLGKFDDFFKPELNKQGDYEGIFWPKSRARTMRQQERLQVDGCAIFWKKNKFKLIDHYCAEFQQLALQKSELRSAADAFNRVMVKDNIGVIALLEQIKTGQRYIIANAHLHWDPAYKDVKLLQTAMLMEEIDRLQKLWTGNEPQAANGSGQLPPIEYKKTVKIPYDENEPTAAEEINENILTDKNNNKYKEVALATTLASQDKKSLPVILCGDFNSLPDSGVFEFLSKGEIEAGHQDFMVYDYGSYTKEALKTNFVLKSSYSHIGELEFTNFTPSFKGVIDYVWYSSNFLNIIGLLSNVDKEYTNKSVGFPDAHHPSDHIPLVISLRAKAVTGQRVKFN